MGSESMGSDSIDMNMRCYTMQLMYCAGESMREKVCLTPFTPFTHTMPKQATPSSTNQHRQLAMGEHLRGLAAEQ